jgi:GNAT superfamily N-acetyltransferase
MPAILSTTDHIGEQEVVALYRAHGWSSADKPGELLAALRNSHCLVTARDDGRLVGLANAISDGHLVAYFPHMLVHPAHQRRGLGRAMVELLMARYKGFHQLMLTADGDAVGFYERVGFTRAGKTIPMWVYSGTEH